MRIGIFAKTFTGKSPLPVLEAVKAAGYDCAQFNLACAGLAAMPDAVPEAVLAQIRIAVAATGIDLVALSGTCNLIHPDKAEREAGLRRLGVVIGAAEALGIPLVTLCTGTRDPLDPWRHHPDNRTPAAWADLRAALDQVLPLAEAAGVDLGIEPEGGNVVASAADACRLLDEMGSRRLRIVLDPANLFEHGSREEVRAIVADAIECLAGDVVMAHAKDRHGDGRIATAGTGVVDFEAFLAGLSAAGFDGPIVAHGFEADEAAGVARFLAGKVAR
jgi:sugar phosphate isomerase/epimerase